MSQNKPGPRELQLRAWREAQAAQVSKPLTKIKKEPTDPTILKHSQTDTKKQVVADLLTRKNGCTSEDVKKATGWSNFSIPALAKSCGLKLTKEKTDRGFRYYGSQE